MAESWACGTCTFLNPPPLSLCGAVVACTDCSGCSPCTDMCGTARPRAPPPPSEAKGQLDVNGVAILVHSGDLTGYCC